MRALLVGMCLLGMGAGLQGEQDSPAPTPPQPPLADRYAELQKEFDAANQKLLERFRNASNDAERLAVREEALRLLPQFAERLLALVGNEAKSKEAFEPLVQAVVMGRGGPASVRAAELLAQHHAAHPQLVPLLPLLARQGGEGGQKLLEVLGEKSSDRKVTGTARFLRAASQVEAADSPTAAAPLPPDKQAAALEAARTQLQQLAREYGDISLPPPLGRTIAQAADDQLYILDHLIVGKVLPDVEVQDLDGKKVKISDYRGKVVVLDIWATWCGPCRAMIPHEREMVERLKGKPFVLISLSADEKKETLTAFLDKEPMPWVHWWNGGASGAALDKYRVQFFPTIFVLDAKGVIRYKHLRGMALEKAVEELLREMTSQ